nr:arginine-glutamic acid dipeptide repeats protein-like [Equus asinus]
MQDASTLAPGSAGLPLTQGERKQGVQGPGPTCSRALATPLPPGARGPGRPRVPTRSNCRPVVSSIFTGTGRRAEVSAPRSSWKLVLRAPTHHSPPEDAAPGSGPQGPRRGPHWLSAERSPGATALPSTPAPLRPFPPNHQLSQSPSRAEPCLRVTGCLHPRTPRRGNSSESPVFPGGALLSTVEPSRWERTLPPLSSCSSSAPLRGPLLEPLAATPSLMAFLDPDSGLLALRVHSLLGHLLPPGASDHLHSEDAQGCTSRRKPEFLAGPPSLSSHAGHSDSLSSPTLSDCIPCPRLLQNSSLPFQHPPRCHLLQEDCPDL